MPKIISYEDALKQASGMGCALLLGNGFSIKHFSYKTLLEKSELKADDPVRILFDRLGTVDFEHVVPALEVKRHAVAERSIMELTRVCG